MNKYPFNKERAMKGEPVVTRDGRKVTDFNTLDLGSYTIKARIVCGGIEGYTDKGEYWSTRRESNFDLFMLTPDPAPSAPIPFDWDKYNSGEWDVVYRNGDKPRAVYNIAASRLWKIVSVDQNGDNLNHMEDGCFSNLVKHEARYDLLLTPKQVTRWFNAYKDKYNNVGAGCTHDSEQDALANIDSERVYIGTYSFTTNAKP